MSTIQEVIDKTISLLREGTLPVMLPLVLLCLVMWILIVERVSYLFGPWKTLLWPPARKSLRQAKRSLARAFDEFLERGDSESRAVVIERCGRVRGPYARFLRSVLLRVRRSSEKQTARDLEILSAEHQAKEDIEKSLLLISTFAKTAPLLGLLGTVTGMIQTFRVMMFASTGDPRALSSGISIALIATEVGLVVSLTGVIASSWLNRRAQVLEEEIQLAALRIHQDSTRESEGAPA